MVTLQMPFAVYVFSNSNFIYHNYHLRSRNYCIYTSKIIIVLHNKFIKMYFIFPLATIKYI